MTDNIVVDADTVASIRNGLRELQGIPPLRVIDGVVEAEVGGRWHRLDCLRRAVDESTLADLQHRGVPWTWLGGRVTNCTDQQGEWVELLEENAKRSWQVAETLWDSVIDGDGRQRDDAAAIHDSMVDQVHALMTSLAFSIKARRPSTDGVPERLFHVWRVRETLSGAWCHHELSDSLDLASMMRARAQVVTQLDGNVVQRLVAAFSEQIFADRITLPGFEIDELVPPTAYNVFWAVAPRVREEAAEKARVMPV